MKVKAWDTYLALAITEERNHSSESGEVLRIKINPT